MYTAKTIRQYIQSHKDEFETYYDAAIAKLNLPSDVSDRFVLMINEMITRQFTNHINGKVFGIHHVRGYYTKYEGLLEHDCSTFVHERLVRESLKLLGVEIVSNIRAASQGWGDGYQVLQCTINEFDQREVHLDITRIKLELKRMPTAEECIKYWSVQGDSGGWFSLDGSCNEFVNNLRKSYIRPFANVIVTKIARIVKGNEMAELMDGSGECGSMIWKNFDFYCRRAVQEVLLSNISFCTALAEKTFCKQILEFTERHEARSNPMDQWTAHWDIYQHCCEYLENEDYNDTIV